MTMGELIIKSNPKKINYKKRIRKNDCKKQTLVFYPLFVFSYVLQILTNLNCFHNAKIIENKDNIQL